MKKLLMLVAGGLLLVSFSAFAEGAREDTPQWGPMGYTGELVEVTGIIELEGGEMPELKTKDGTYELMYPWFMTTGIEISEGDEITVSGYIMPGPPWEADEDEKHLRVVSAVIDGQEYDLSDSTTGNWGYFGGSHKSMMGGPRGRGSYSGSWRMPGRPRAW